MNRNRLLARGAGHVPGLKRLPILKWLAFGEIALLAKRHIERLTPAERRRLFEVVKKSHGRPSNLTKRERRDLERIVHKLEPRAFAGQAADHLSPIPLPRRITRVPKREQRDQSRAA